MRNQTRLVTLIYQNNLHVFFFQLKECIKYYSWKFFDFENKYLSEEKKTYRHFFVGNKYLYSLCLIKVDPSPKFDEMGHVTRYREGGLIPSLVNE